MFNLFASKKESEKIALVKEIINDLDYLYEDLENINLIDERKSIESKIRIRENLLNNLNNI